MIFKFALFLAALQPASAQFGLANGNGNGNGNASGNGNGNGNAGSGGNNNNSGSIPLTSVRSFDGAEDPRSGNDAELLRTAGPANYPDGRGEGDSMFTEPNARGISNAVCDPDTLATPPGKSIVSDMFWQWGQLMDHDIGLTEGLPTNEAFTIVSPTCTSGDIICNIPFNRALHHFTNGVREQLNEITGFLDASMVYGHTDERAAFLREFTGGRMKMTTDGLLPPATGSALANALPGGFTEPNLFIGGDVRVNEQIGLIAIHTLLVREHNRLAGLLSARFGGASDEDLFQMARKLVIAEVQKITYAEFLPILIGSAAPSLAAYDGFDSSVNPGVATEFSACAFRMGHTFLSGSLLMHNGQTSTGSISLLNAFFDPDLVIAEPNLIDEILIGQTVQAANARDTKIIPEVRDFLFGNRAAGTALDLVALNIQRGRDHGLLKYNDMRVGLGLSAKASFNDITSNTEIANELSGAYGGDISLCDPWICGIGEDAVGGGQLGELFTTIIADQFQRLMDGDRFFYLNDPDISDNRITNGIVDISTITLADVINFNTVGGVGPDAMLA